ncbi:MAG: alanine--tRNA ligase [Candidatus Omnitrophica bacterium]|nr:alanine--tRNA ligase [Candidatus Omnitrophota bacterium]
MTTANEIREKFLSFFKEKGHKIFPSSSLLPQDDPSLLFTSAGMNQFKEFFLHPPEDLKRAASCQKCLRTADIEEVGRVPGHHTFFEMLGNFSFGDYYKEEAIEWAWEFLTSKLRLPAEKLWVSVFEDDEESAQIWKKKIGLPEERIKKFGSRENFWPSNALEEGPDGPCGPCSEIFYDWGAAGQQGREKFSPDNSIEVWNLVFTQFNRDKGRIEELKNKNVDTGMGLERLTAVLQGVRNDFETDLFKPIVKSLPAPPTSYPLPAHYIIADYIRAVVFAIADGAIPANEREGYVIRKLIRKAASLGRDLKIESPFLYNLVPVVVKLAEGVYPEVKEAEKRIKETIKEEEAKFIQTINRAISILDNKKDINEKTAFELYDTYGLPYEEIENLVSQRGIELNRQKFIQYVEKQRQRSREKSVFNKQIFTKQDEKERAKKQGLPLPGVWGEEEIDVARNHTATHILQSVLREILGRHIRQAGSIIFPAYFHFDFTHPRGLTREELTKVEEMVNNRILNNDPVERELMPKQKAIEAGAIGLFEEKYGEEVQVVSIGNYSKEFCGGVHVRRTGEIGLFKIIKESSVAAGIRRIEAISGRFVYQLIKEEEDTIEELAQIFSASRKKIIEKAKDITQQLKEWKKRNERLKRELFGYYAKDIFASLDQEKVRDVVIHQFFGFDFPELREISDVLRKKIDSDVIGLASVKDNKIYLIMTTTRDLSGKIHCGQVINEIAEQLDGRGGGRADFAQATAKDINKLPEVLKIWEERVRELL